MDNNKSTKRIVIDIESDNLLDSITKIWFIVIREIDNKENNNNNIHVIYNPDDLKSYLEKQHGLSLIVVGHNIIGFDLPALEKIWNIPFDLGFFGDDGWNGVPCVFIDTLHLSQFINPDRHGGHSLENLGTLAGNPKTSHKDFSELTPEMIDYSIQDTSSNASVLDYLINEMERS